MASVTAIASSSSSSSSSHRYADVCDILPAATSGARRVNYEEGARYDSLCFGDEPRARLLATPSSPPPLPSSPKSAPFLKNTVLLVPDLLSATECARLVAECELRVQFQETNPESWLSAMEEMTHDELPFERHEIKDLSAETQAFFQVVLRERLLPFVSEHLPPAVEANLWKNTEVVWEYVPIWSLGEGAAAAKGGGNSAGRVDAAGVLDAGRPLADGKVEVRNAQPKRNLATQHFKFSESEPTINRYTAGGRFIPHRDALALTVNVLLSDTFTGGGTQFWEEGVKEDVKSPTLCLLPRTGVGIVFNGTVLHAGRAVTGGVRHLLVASFSVVERKARPATSAFVQQRQSMRQAHGAAAERLRNRLAQRRAASVAARGGGI
jgi:hypothetical protein